MKIYLKVYKARICEFFSRNSNIISIVIICYLICVIMRVGDNMKILIKNALVLDMVGDNPNIRELDVLINDNFIYKIDLSISESADKVINAKGKLLMPGFVNTHTHLAMSFFRGYKDEKKLEDWLYNVIFPVEAKMSQEDVYHGACLSCIEMIKSGTTTCNDMYFESEGTIKAIEESGLRAFVCWNITDFMINDHIERTKKYFKKYNKENSKIKIISSLHAPYTCKPETVKLVTDLAKELDLPIHLHLSETCDEEKTIKERYGKTSTEYLYDLGVFNHPVILAHSIHLSDNDLKLLKNIKGGMSTNPISNSKLASGVCDVVKLRKLGFNVGIGSDGQGSTTTLDIFEELRTCAYLQKLKYNDPTIIRSYDILKMATIEGARVLRLEKEIGTIEVGKKADMIIIDLMKPNLWPCNDICSSLVFAGNTENISTVLIDGKIIMENKKVLSIDEKKVMSDAKKCADKLLSL